MGFPSGVRRRVGYRYCSHPLHITVFVSPTGPVTSVAFSAVLPDRLAHADAADTLNRFMVPDFVVATRNSRIVSVQVRHGARLRVGVRARTSRQPAPEILLLGHLHTPLLL